MKGIIRFVLNNKFAVWIITVIVAAAGIYSGLNMKMETIPSLNLPVITVSTTYPGATPDEVADKVTEPIEQQVSNLSGVKVVSSSSFQNASSIQIEYGFKEDMNDAKKDVKEALSDLELPDAAKTPDVARISMDAFPVLSLSVSNSHESFTDLTKTVNDTIVPKLEGIEGVSSVKATGQQVKKVELNFDQKKLAKNGLDEKTVEQVIKGSASSFPLGLLQFDDQEKSVVIDGDTKTLKDLRNIRIPVTPNSSSQSQTGQMNGTKGQSAQSGEVDGQTPSKGSSNGKMQQPGSMAQGGKASGKMNSHLPTVKLHDLADLKVVNESDSISRTNGKHSIGIQITKGADANTVDVTDAVKDKVKQLKKDHKGLEAVPMFDQGDPIKQSVNTMLEKALLGALFAVIIILLFLRNIRSTIISIVSIPMSLLIAILLADRIGITLNIMTLGAMTVAIGRVVDDSIVVIENIYRRMSLPGEKLKGRKLISAATRQMFMPILSSTIVTVAVFLPLAFVTGPVGQMFFPFAMTIVFALGASLLVAITIVPILAHTFFKKGLKYREEPKKGPGPMKRFYRNLLDTALNHKFISFGIAVVILAGSLLLIPKIGVSFLPSQGEKYLIATYKSEPGQTLDDVEDVAKKASKYIQNRKGVDTVQYSAGGDNPMNPGSSNDAVFFVEYDKDFRGFDKEQKKVIGHLQKTTDVGEWKTQDFGATASSNKLTMYVYGKKLDDVQPAVKKLTDKIKGDKTFTDVDSSLSEAYDQYTLAVNQKKLSQYGLTPAQIGMKLNQGGEEPVLTTVKDKGEDLKVYLQTDKQKYKDVDDLTDTKIDTPLGKKIPLSKVVDVKKGKTPDTITRRDGRIYAQVTAKTTTDDVGAATDQLKQKVDQLNLPSSVDVEFGGVTEDINNSFTQLGLAMLAAIAIVYLILVITFGGGLAPLAILFSLPFTAIGGLLALFISGETLSVSALIGALMLIGIVVTNAIVLIDRVVRNEKEGMTTRKALLEAGATRLRPILMTALATVFALAPLAAGLEGSALISKGLGITVIGGLISSTLLTLVIVPVVYEFLMKFRRRHPSEVEENE